MPTLRLLESTGGSTVVFPHPRSRTVAAPDFQSRVKRSRTRSRSDTIAALPGFSADQRLRYSLSA